MGDVEEETVQGGLVGQQGEELANWLLREGWAGPKRQHQAFRLLQPTLRSWSVEPEKNRDPLCPLLDHSRLALPPLDAGGKSRRHAAQDPSYIHASWINKNSQQPYIMTQLPLKQTQGDFWRMVWEEDVRVLVCLMDLEAEAPEDVYLPLAKDAKMEIAGPAQLVWHLEDSTDPATHSPHPDFRLRSLFITKKGPGVSQNLSHKICHLSYLKWPSAELASPPDSLLELMKRATTENGKFGMGGPGGYESPILVQCWNGARRSGTAVALAVAEELLVHKKQVAIGAIVADVRLRRHGSLQSPAHYVFLHRRLLQEAIQLKLVSLADPHIPALLKALASNQ